jgi:hypothetical protein
MSLVLLGNRFKNASGAGVHIGQEAQATFTNYFSNPIVLPPYSQVALHGAKICRSTAATKDEIMLFVRLKGLNVQSFNGVNSGISQIVGAIEDFNITPSIRHNGNDVDSLNASGSIYRAVASPVYLDLNNPHELRLSTLSCDIVNQDEQLASHLTHQTNIILHFRRGRKPKPDIE